MNIRIKLLCTLAILASTAHGRGSVLWKFGNSHATDAVYATDGTKVVVADELGATTWDVATQKPLGFTPISAVEALALSPGGTHVAAGNKVYDLSTNAVVGSWSDPDRSWPLAFSPDGARLLTSDGQMIRLWEWATATMVSSAHVTIAGNGGVPSASFSPDGKRVVVLAGAASLWDLQNGATETYELLSDGGPVTAVCFSPDSSHVALGNVYGGVSLLDATSATTVREFGPPGPHSIDKLRISDVAITPQGSLIAVGADSIHMWEVSTGRPLAVIPKALGYDSLLAVSPNGSSFVASDGGVPTMWSTTASESTPLPGHRSTVGTLALSADGSKLLSSGLNEAIVWDTRDGRALRTFKRSIEFGVVNAISPDGSMVFLGSDSVWSVESGFRLYDADPLATPTPIATPLPGEPIPPWYLEAGAFSADGTRVVTINRAGKMTVHAAGTGDLISASQIPPLYASGRACAFSPDATRVAIAAIYGMTILRTSDAGVVRTARVNSYAVAFSSDGQRIAFTNRQGMNAPDDSAIIEEAESGAPVSSFRVNFGESEALAFSPDGSMLAAGASVWDVMTGKRVTPIEWLSADSDAVAFASDGMKIYADTWQGVVALSIGPLAAILGTREASQAVGQDLNGDGVVDAAELVQ